MKKLLLYAVCGLLALAAAAGCAPDIAQAEPSTGASENKSELVVGKDIRAEDITDFYYTYENINYNAFYQRYRFYTEDGKYMFFHETRERPDEYGPATEEDTTLTGCFDLQEAEWKQFLGYLKDGTVKPRSEDVTTGDSGPWTYLYWTGDESIYQEYSFSSGSMGGEFKAFCESLAARSIPAPEAQAGGGQDFREPDSYEVRFLLDADKVLDEDNQLKQEFIDAFSAGEKKVKRYGLFFLETPDRTFSGEGWFNRVRIREDKPEKGYKFTFKKRYPVQGDDISAAMQLAEAEGFDLTGKEWESQIEWGISGMTLSLSVEAEYPLDGKSGIADLSAEEAGEFCETQMPSAERDWKSEGWGTQALKAAKEAGPVFFKRYTGTCAETKIEIEIWEFPEADGAEARYIAELSAECRDAGEAVRCREGIKDTLTELDILLQTESLKTQMVLDMEFGA